MSDTGQTHHLPCDLPWGRRTRAHWALNSAKKLVIFVHGFAGDSEKTWRSFPELFRHEAEFRTADVVFYGYDSLRAGAVALAAELRAFLELVIARPALAVNTNIDFGQRPENFQYEKVLVVAHSLGAVVVRRALLDMEQLHNADLRRIELVLFAPAHLGADVLPLAREILGAVKLLPVASLAAYRFRVLRDLRRGSKVLEQLEDQTQALIGPGRCPHVARVVVHGDEDRIVEQAAFCGDPPAVFEAKNHTTICKPDDHYRNPLRHVVGAL